jgi:hypothetical protein
MKNREEKKRGLIVSLNSKPFIFIKNKHKSPIMSYSYLIPIKSNIQKFSQI